MGLWKALTDHQAQTGAASADPGLAGRTYAIPFGFVWDAAVRLSAGGLGGWKMLRWDDQEGQIEAEVRSPIFAFPSDVTISITLDENGQTRVDLTALGRHRGGDLGANVRRIKRFLRALDRDLRARPEQILDTRSSEVYAA